jgi:tetratricopeptide (TPR) repeat protein
MGERILAVVSVGLLVLTQACFAQPASGPAEQAVATRVSGAAQQLLRQQQLAKPVFEQAAVLFALAARLDPAEPRYWRLLAEAEIQSGNREGAIAALQGLENTNPRDTIPGVWVRLIDLYLQGMQQVPEQLEYLEQIYNQQSVPPSVRSHAALRAAELRFEQAAPGMAMEWVRKALELNPANPAAARLQWQLVADQDDHAVRTKALLTLVQADPGTLANIATLADQLAQAGYTDAALTWYALAIQISQRLGPVDPALVFDYAAELFIANDSMSASNLANQLLQADPTNSDAQFLRLLLDVDKPRELREESRTAARESLLKQLAAVRQQGGVEQTSGALDLGGDLKKLQESDDADLKAAYASAVADLVWFDLYFAGPTEATDRLLEFLRAVAPADSATLARLEGWNFLLRNKPDEARVKLEAAAAREPLARLGLLRMVDRNDDAAMQRMTEDGQLLLSQHPSGLIGAFLASELRQFNIRVQPHPSVADMANQVRTFSRDWPQIYTNPATFYTVRVQPLKVSHQIGEPILARVEIQNNSQYALSIDPIGAIRPDLWFDVKIQGAIQQNLQGVAYDRLMQAVVLQPRDVVSQIVRLDRGELASMLDGNPQIAFPMTFSITTNPQTMQTQEGAAVVVPGLAGQSVAFTRIINREAGKADGNTLNQLTNKLQGGLPEQKIEALDYLRFWVVALRQQLAAPPNPALTPDQQQQMSAQIRDLLSQFIVQINRARQDPQPAIAAWATYSMAMIAEGDERAEVLRQMRASNNPAQMLLSLLAAQQLDPALATDVATRLQGSDDPMVQRLAAATLEVAKLPPPPAATQPETPDAALTK